MERLLTILILVLFGGAAFTFGLPDQYDWYGAAGTLWLLAAVYGYLTAPRRPL